jgi:hypothetical protein
MTTAVAQLIAFLQTLPAEATVNVLHHVDGCGHYDQGGYVETHELDLAGVDDYKKVQHIELDTNGSTADRLQWGGERNDFSNVTSITFGTTGN